MGKPDTQINLFDKVSALNLKKELLDPSRSLVLLMPFEDEVFFKKISNSKEITAAKITFNLGPIAEIWAKNWPYQRAFNYHLGKVEEFGFFSRMTAPIIERSVAAMEASANKAWTPIRMKHIGMTLIWLGAGSVLGILALIVEKLKFKDHF